MNQQCKVCGEPAAGFHFGAFTCEGCKSFFGRTYNNMSSISECKNNGDCVINKKNRTSCKSCRLRKCLLVGMSKSGSRYGRRSNWFKIHCLLQEQGSSVNAANGLNPNFMGANGTSLYPGFFGARHMLNTDKFLEARLNGFSPFSEGKNSSRSEHERYRSSSEDSGGSSRDMEDESRCTSAVSHGPSSSHQTPSPFSEKDYAQNQKKTSNLSHSPNIPNSASAFTSPNHFCNSSYVSPILRPLAPHLTSFPVTRDGITPTSGNLLYFDALGNSPWNSRNGGDLLLCSSAPVRIAIDQDQPIDLSVKSPHDPNTNSSRSSAESNADHRVSTPDLNSNEDIKNLHIPLDLTSKRSAELLS